MSNDFCSQKHYYAHNGYDIGTIREASNNTPITISAANILVMTVDEEDGGNEGVEDCVENIVGREEVKMTAIDGIEDSGTSDDTEDDVTCEVVKCGASKGVEKDWETDCVENVWEAESSDGVEDNKTSDSVEYVEEDET